MPLVRRTTRAGIAAATLAALAAAASAAPARQSPAESSAAEPAPQAHSQSAPTQAPSDTAPQAPSDTAPQAPSDTAPQAQSDSAPQAPSETERAIADEAARALAAGDWERAKVLIDGLLFGRRVADARAALAAGEAGRALAGARAALALAPDAREALILEARAQLLLAESGADAAASAPRDSTTDASRAAGEAALATFRRFSDDAACLVGASRAALLLGHDDSLALARAAIARLEEPGASASALFHSPERAWADAALAAWRRARSGDAGEAADAVDSGESGESGDASALLREAEDALRRRLGRAPADAEAWGLLGDVYVAQERWDDALATLERGLDRTPDARALLERLHAAAFRVGRGEDALARFVARHPDVAAGHALLGRARLEAAAGTLAAGGGADVAAAFAGAEDALARAEALALEAGDARVAGEARDAATLARTGAGWAWLAAGELETARVAFETAGAREDDLRRAHEAFDAALEGLAAVADAWVARGRSERAARICAWLAEREPRAARWPTRAGAHWRDAAIEEASLAARLCRAARGELDDDAALAELRGALAGSRDADVDADERARFAAAADAHNETARAWMERGYAAFVQAMRLAPGDLRLTNDCARLLLCYLDRDGERARELLLRSIAMGAVQRDELRARLAALDDAAAERAPLERELWKLENAWGDAHQLLGVLLHVLEGDDAAARRYFERALEIGPEPRPVVRDVWLRKLDGERIEHPDALTIGNWARPCD